MSITKGFGGTYSGWLALIPNPIISVNEAWFQTNTEKVHHLFWKLNEVIDTVNTETELFKKLSGILDTFDDTVKEAVEDYIKQMYEDGSLQSIIREFVNDYMSNHLLSKTASLTMARKWRRMNATGVNDCFNTSQLYSVNQGSCVYRDRNNVLKFAMIQGKKSRPTEGVENNQIGVFNFEYQNPERTNVIPIGHGQDICYKDGYFYITQSTINSLTQSIKITRVNEQTLQYNQQDDKEFENHNPYCIAVNNDDILVYDTVGNSIYKLDWDNDNLEYLYSIDIASPVNGMDCKDGFLFMASGENINVYDVNDGTLVWCYNLPDVSVDGYNRGEIEALSFIPDSKELAVFTWAQVGLTSGVSQRNLSQAFVVNPYTNNIKSVYTETDKVTTKQAILYVCGNLQTGYEQNFRAEIVNPDGSYDSNHNIYNPFATIQEALDYAGNLNNDSVVIRMTERNDRTFNFITGQNVQIQNYTQQFSGNPTNIYFGGSFIQSGGTLSLIGGGENRCIGAQATFTSKTGDFAFDSNIASINILYGGTLYLGRNIRLVTNLSGYTPVTQGLHSNIGIVCGVNWGNRDNNMIIHPMMKGTVVSSESDPEAVSTPLLANTIVNSGVPYSATYVSNIYAKNYLDEHYETK